MTLDHIERIARNYNTIIAKRTMEAVQHARARQEYIDLEDAADAVLPEGQGCERAVRDMQGR